MSEDAKLSAGAFKTGTHDDMATVLGLTCLFDPSGQQVRYLPNPFDTMAQGQSGARCPDGDCWSKPLGRVRREMNVASGTRNRRMVSMSSKWASDIVTATVAVVAAVANVAVAASGCSDMSSEVWVEEEL